MDLSQSLIDDLLAGADALVAEVEPKPEPPKVSPSVAKAAEAQPVPCPRLATSSLSVDQILSLSVPISVRLAERDLAIEAILQTTVGTIIEFDVPFDADLFLEVAGEPIGSGQAVKIGENFGIRVTAIEPLRKRIDALGPTA